MRNSILATALLVTTVTGMGVFALPFAFAQNGPIAHFWFWLALAVTLSISFMFGEAIFRSNEALHLAGYARKYLGTAWGIAALALDFTAIALATVIGSRLIGDQLLPIVFPDIQGASAGLVFLLLVLFLVIFDLKSLTYVEFLFNFVIIGLFAVLSAFSFTRFDIGNLTQPAQAASNYSLTYGIALFSFGGLSVLPEIRRVIGNDANTFRKVVLAGYAIVVAVYLLFILSTLGAVGPGVSPDSLASLALILPLPLLYAAIGLAVVNVFTTLIAIGYYMKETLLFDMKFPPIAAYLFFAVPSVLLYLVLPGSFAQLLELTGAFSTGLIALTVVCLYASFKKKEHFVLSRGAVIATGAVFVLGIIATQL